MSILGDVRDHRRWGVIDWPYLLIRIPRHHLPSVYFYLLQKRLIVNLAERYISKEIQGVSIV
jgi:hypothetical protein